MCPYLLLAVPLFAIFGVVSALLAATVALVEVLEAFFAMLAVAFAVLGILIMASVAIFLVIGLVILIRMSKGLLKKRNEWREETAKAASVKSTDNDEAGLQSEVQIPRNVTGHSNRSKFDKSGSHALATESNHENTTTNDDDDNAAEYPIFLSDLEVLAPPSEEIPSPPPPMNPFYTPVPPGESHKECAHPAPPFDAPQNKVLGQKQDSNSCEFYFFWLILSFALGGLFLTFQMIWQETTCVAENLATQPKARGVSYAYRHLEHGLTRRSKDGRQALESKTACPCQDAFSFIERYLENEEKEVEWLEGLVLPFASLLEYIDASIREVFLEDYESILMGVQSFMPSEEDQLLV